MEPARRLVPAHRERGQPHAHRIGGHLRGPAAGARGDPAGDRGQAPVRPALPPEGAVRPARPRPPRLGRRPALRPRLPHPPHRDPASGRRGAAAQPREPGDVAAAGPRQAAVGDLDRRGPAGRPLGHDLQDPSLDGRRRLEQRPAERHHGPDARAAAVAAGPVASGARAESRLSSSPTRWRSGRRAPTRRSGRSRRRSGARAASLATCCRRRGTSPPRAPG